MGKQVPDSEKGAAPAGKKRCGFAILSPERRAEIAAMGGREAQRTGKAHRWRTYEEAAAAGRKGGLVHAGDFAHFSALGKQAAQARKAQREVRP